MKKNGVMKKNFITWLKFAAAILAVGIIFLVTATGIYIASIVINTVKPIQVRTDTEPIYNHFPDLPETSEIQWCSKSSEGIGPITTYIYIFAFYDDDIGKELRDMNIKDGNEDIELYFVPEGIDVDQKWKFVEGAGFAFQNEIKDTRKMYTNVYINETGTILYIEAVGD
ncbi:MAG: hypothetical protein K2N90_13110 [Lachnospiraceae bacterium]|nr:hypothetical protein [Lachnospiraceae bacterium]